MKRIKKAVASVGKYTNRDGQEKTRYHNVGTLFKREDGSVCLKLDAVPVGPDFEGWINFYDLEESSSREKPEAATPAKDVESDDVPF
jgi:hypothetical protein